MESTTTRLQNITSKSGESQQGPWTRYDFHFDGIKRPMSTFDETLFDPALQGKMVRASYTSEPASFTAKDTGAVVNYTRYTLQNIAVVEGDTGTLDEVLAPIAQQEQVQTVVDRTTNGAPASPSEATRQADIQRAVALKAAVEIAVGMLSAGDKVDTSYITRLAAQFEPYLSGQSG